MPVQLQGTLAIAYGKHVVEGHQVYRKTIGSGDTSVTTVVCLLGKGVWAGIEKAYHKGRLLLDTDYRFHSGTLSTSMAVATQRTDGSWTQGIDSWIDGGQTYSGIAYVVVKLYGLSVDEEISDLKFICKTGMVNVWNSDGDPTIPSDTSIPIDFSDLDVYENLVYSTNPADCFADLVVKKRLVGPLAINWTYWQTYRDMCGATVNWPDGSLAGIPTYSVTNVTTGENGALHSAGANGVATTDSSIPSAGDGYFEFAPKYGPMNVGLAATSPITVSTDITHQLTFGADGTVIFNGDAFATPVTFTEGDFFRIGYSGGAFFILKNSVPLDLTGLTIPTRSTALHGAVEFDTTAGYILASAVRPAGDPSRTRTRFECGLAFSQPTDIASALQSIMYTTCSEMQYIDGKVCILCPSFNPSGSENYTRTSVHSFNLSNIVESTFEVHRLAKEQRLTNLTGRYRNIDDDYLTEDSISVDRLALETSIERRVDGGDIWLGTMTRAQAECVTNFHMKVSSDLDLFCRFTAGADAWRVLPGDFVTVTHDLLEWTDKLFLVIEATDDSPGERADTKAIVLQEFMQDVYSDSDFSPLDSSITVFLANQIKLTPAEEAAASMTFGLSMGSVVLSNGTELTEDNANAFWDFTNHRLGLGTASPDARLHVLGTTEQARFGYDATHYLTVTCDATGLVTLSGAGSGKGVQFASGMKLGFFGATPVAQRADIGALVDDMGGAGYDDGMIVNTGNAAADTNFSQMLDQINKMRAALRTLGLMA